MKFSRKKIGVFKSGWREVSPDQQVPHHNANSNVTFMVVHGEGTLNIGNEVTRIGPGKLLRVPFQSAMSIKNESG